MLPHSPSKPSYGPWKLMYIKLQMNLRLIRPCTECFWWRQINYLGKWEGVGPWSRASSLQDRTKLCCTGMTSPTKQPRKDSFPSPFASVSALSRGHPSLVTLELPSFLRCPGYRYNPSALYYSNHPDEWRRNPRMNLWVKERGVKG